jgi:hypothetical protein
MDYQMFNNFIWEKPYSFKQVVLVLLNSLRLTFYSIKK